MEINDLISVGIIKKAVGNSGFVAIIPDTDFPEHFYSLSKIFLVFPDNTVHSKIIESCQITQNKILLKFKNVNTKGEAQGLKNAQIMISEDELYQLHEDQFYQFQLKECQVVLTNGKKVGKVDYIFSTNANDILVVSAKSGSASGGKDGTKEILIPFCDQFIKNISKSEKKIIIEPIEGLLDAN